MGTIVDLTGKVFGELTVIRLAGRARSRQCLWECRCSCGALLTVCGQSLRERQRACRACAYVSSGLKHRTHGESRDKGYLYHTWKSIKDRCYNRNNKAYHNYGGRGISLYRPWIADYGAFAAYIRDTIGERPEGMTLNRPNWDRGYVPGNLEWADLVKQAEDRRTTIWLCVDGITKPLARWAEEYRVRPHLIYMRLRLGWSHKQAVQTPITKVRSRKQTGRYSTERLIGDENAGLPDDE